MLRYTCFFVFFFFNDTATTEIYTLSLHDALPICPGGILTRRAHMTRPVHDEQVLHVVGLLELVEHRRLGVAAHPRRAQLVNGPPLGEHLLVGPYDLDPRRLEHLAARDDHVLAHLALVVAELIMEAQRGDAPRVFRVGIEIDIILVARQHLAEATHPDERPGVVTHLSLELRAESRGPKRIPGEN